MHAYIFCMCICMCTHMCAYACSGQRSLLIVLPSSSPRYLLTQGVSLHPELKGSERLGSSALQAPPISASPALEFTGAWCHAHFLYVCRELQVFSWLHSERFANGAVSSASISCFETRSFCVAYGDIEMSSHVVFKLKRVVFTSYFVFLNQDN